MNPDPKHIEERIVGDVGDVHGLFGTGKAAQCLHGVAQTIKTIKT